MNNIPHITVPSYPPIQTIQLPVNYSNIPLQSNNSIPTINNTQTIPFTVPPLIRVEIINNVNAQQEWSTGIFDCCIKPASCCLGTFAPCVLYGKNVEQLNNDGCCSSALCCCLLPCSCFIRAPIRRKLRNKYNLQTEPCNDLCVSIFCPLCALCQEHRELVYREFEKPKKQYMV